MVDTLYYYYYLSIKVIEYRYRAVFALVDPWLIPGGFLPFSAPSGGFWWFPNGISSLEGGFPLQRAPPAAFTLIHPTSALAPIMKYYAQGPPAPPSSPLGHPNLYHLHMTQIQAAYPPLADIGVSTIGPPSSPQHPCSTKKVFNPAFPTQPSPHGNTAPRAALAITSPLMRRATFLLDTLLRLMLPLSYSDASRITEWTGTVPANAYRPFEDHPRGRAGRKSG